jgi:hypothetical protein
MAWYLAWAMGYVKLSFTLFCPARHYMFGSEGWESFILKKDGLREIARTHAWVSLSMSPSTSCFLFSRGWLVTERVDVDVPCIFSSLDVLALFVVRYVPSNSLLIIPYLLTLLHRFPSPAPLLLFSPLHSLQPAQPQHIYSPSSSNTHTVIHATGFGTYPSPPLPFLNPHWTNSTITFSLLT